MKNNGLTGVTQCRLSALDNLQASVRAQNRQDLVHTAFVNCSAKIEYLQKRYIPKILLSSQFLLSSQAICEASSQRVQLWYLIAKSFPGGLSLPASPHTAIQLHLDIQILCLCVRSSSYSFQPSQPFLTVMWHELKLPAQRLDLTRFCGYHSWTALFLSKSLSTLFPAGLSLQFRL